MKKITFRDIVNREVVNLENCEDEPINIPGLIQPHGFLIAIDVKSNIITVCSENIDQYIDYDFKELLGKKIESVFKEDFIRNLEPFKSSQNLPTKEFEYHMASNLLAFSIHRNNTEIIVEAEPTEKQHDQVSELYNSSKQLLGYIQDSSTLKELTNSVAIAIKNITKYDRVMIYRFDADYNGEIIAESKEDHLEPFLGLHYPHTDIPVQARELYIKNHLRIIGDINYKPVPLYTFLDSEIEHLDLSLSILRSVSPIHIQYLQNMGVGATLTISLLHSGKLWGLITCHHYSPKYLSQEIRNIVKIHGHFITSQIDVRLLNEQYEIARKANQAVDHLTSKSLKFDKSSIASLFEVDAILDICNSIGVSAFIGTDFYTYGNTPSTGDIAVLTNFIGHLAKNGKFTTHRLSRITDDLKSISKDFPGINYYSLGNEHDCIIWYRHTTIKDIHWAGDPSKSIEKDKNSLSPRKSFALFTENVKDCSKVWLQAELEACDKFYNFFQTHLQSIRLQEEKDNQQRLTKILSEANEELENINWISTHDLQEPLRKIRIMASSLLLKSEENSLPDTVQNQIIKMQNSAERMQTLITDILKYTKTSSQTPEFETINLNELLENLRKELEPTLEEAKATLIIKPLPSVKGMPFLLKQVFLNIVYNSLKFKSHIRDPKIEISFNEQKDNATWDYKDYLLIEIKDNGIGFENEYKDKVFKIFARLNNKSDYEGSGIGLALCKKIMTKHNGFIDASGVLGKGTTLKLYFPK